MRVSRGPLLLDERIFLACFRHADTAVRRQRKRAGFFGGNSPTSGLGFLGIEAAEMTVRPVFPQ